MQIQCPLKRASNFARARVIYDLDFSEGRGQRGGYAAKDFIVDHVYREIMRYADRMGPHEWFLMMGAMIVVGLICMRGFGSRSQY